MDNIGVTCPKCKYRECPVEDIEDIMKWTCCKCNETFEFLIVDASGEVLNGNQEF